MIEIFPTKAKCILYNETRLFLLIYLVIYIYILDLFNIIYTLFIYIYFLIYHIYLL